MRSHPVPKLSNRPMWKVMVLLSISRGTNFPNFVCSYAAVRMYCACWGSTSHDDSSYFHPNLQESALKEWHSQNTG
jgi:hypothetical protein